MGLINMAAFEQPFDASQYHASPLVEDSAAEYNFREKSLRDLFVAEYLNDFDQVKAAQRCGFQFQFAIEFARKFMDEPYVQQQIKRVKLGQDQPIDEKEEERLNKKRIFATLFQEAHYHGPGSSHAARVSALGKLAVMYGMEAPKKTEATVTHKGGVMAVPGIASLDEWEVTASKSQDALITHANQSGQK